MSTTWAGKNTCSSVKMMNIAVRKNAPTPKRRQQFWLSKVKRCGLKHPRLLPPKECYVVLTHSSLASKQSVNLTKLQSCASRSPHPVARRRSWLTDFQSHMVHLKSLPMLIWQLIRDHEL